VHGTLSSGLSLALLVFWVLADDPHYATPLDNLALLTTSLDRWFDLHDSYLPGPYNLVMI
jgi:hypothetical protein